ncbi:MAG: hypothetical protein PHR35_21685, partial [Kiritimatiellae bacterium]|nr:hypothetical protein [Kiritimatiellia bacterium]
LSDFMRIFQASRKLLDRICVHGKQTRQIHWLWSGWGQPHWWTRKWTPRDQNNFMRATIRVMQKEVPEPWWLIAGRHEYLPACAEEGVLDKTVYLPYNTIEGEPSRPGTQVNFRQQRRQLDKAARYPGLAGLMGNVQTPLLQFPHVGHFIRTAWDFSYRKRTSQESLRDSAALVYPRHRELLADGWLALAPGNRTRAGKLADRLERLIQTNSLGQPGAVGQRLFPGRDQFSRDLVCQLRASAAFEVLCGTTARGAKAAECARAVEGFLAAALAWDHRHGWSAYWNKLGGSWTLWPVQDPACQAAVRGLRKVLGGRTINGPTVEAFLAPIGARLAQRHDPSVVGRCGITPLAKALLDAKAKPL